MDQVFQWPKNWLDLIKRAETLLNQLFAHYPVLPLKKFIVGENIFRALLIVATDMNTKWVQGELTIWHSGPAPYSPVTSFTFEGVHFYFNQCVGVDHLEETDQDYVRPGLEPEVAIDIEVGPGKEESSMAVDVTVRRRYVAEYIEFDIVVAPKEGIVLTCDACNKLTQKTTNGLCEPCNEKKEEDPEAFEEALLKQKILNSFETSMSNFLYYDRKEDEELDSDTLRDALNDGIVTKSELIAVMDQGFKNGNISIMSEPGVTVTETDVRTVKPPEKYFVVPAKEGTDE